MSEILEGAVGELGTIAVWGSRGREGSRTIQLPIFLFYFLIYTAAILLSLCYPHPFYHPYYSNPIVYHHLRITGLCCGILSLPLFLLQMDHMEKYNILTKLRTLRLTFTK